MSAPLRFWRIADHAGLAWRHWDGEYVFHHALANDTHRLSEAAGAVLLLLLERGELEEEALAEAGGLERADLDVILSALAKIDFVAWR
jgi:transcription initiation factor IIE alpha subunit